MSSGAKELTRSCPDCGQESPYSKRFCDSCGSPGALLDLFSEDYRLDRGDRVLGILERRGWDRQRPAIRRSVRGRSRPGDAFVESEIASGATIRIRWSYWHPRWAISSIQFLDD